MNDCEDLVARDAFTAAMRQVASSVSVVTTNGPAGRHGATVSAFCSVSADPPTTLVCLNAGSRIAKLVAGNGVFFVNVLPQGAQDIADRFAGAHDDKIGNRFEDIACSRAGAPVLSDAVVLECRVTQSVRSGSHDIFVGHVTEISGQVEAPLAYLNGAYHQVTPLAAD